MAKIDNFKKSNDEKYLTEIKNITGNSLNDKELSDLASKDEGLFLKDLKDLFLSKRTSREKS